MNSQGMAGIRENKNSISGQNSGQGAERMADLPRSRTPFVNEHHLRKSAPDFLDCGKRSPTYCAPLS
jgi:hypothetical protein